MNASVAITLGHFGQSCVKGVPKGTAHQETKDCHDNGIGLGAAPLRIIKTWAAIVDAVASHERTRERAHVQQYGVGGMPRQPFG